MNKSISRREFLKYFLGIFLAFICAFKFPNFIKKNDMIEDSNNIKY